MIKLFVSGFPLEIEEIELAKLFAVHGDISTIKIVRDKKTKICKGYAFIEMAGIAGADAAVEALNGAIMGGKHLTVTINEETVTPDEPVRQSTHQSPPPVYKKVAKPTGEQRSKRPRRGL